MSGLSHVELIDAAFERLVRMTDIGFKSGVSVKLVASALGVDVDVASSYLQEHLQAQDRATPPEFSVACRHYGTAAKWYVLNKPGADAKYLQRARQAQAHWVAVDSLRRALRDSSRELGAGEELGSDADKAIASQQIHMLGGERTSYMEACVMSGLPIDDSLIEAVDILIREYAS